MAEWLLLARNDSRSAADSFLPVTEARSVTASRADRNQLAAAGLAPSNAVSNGTTASISWLLNSFQALAASTEPAPSGPTALILATDGPISAAAKQFAAPRATMRIPNKRCM